MDRALIGRIGVGKVSILKVAREWTLTSERSLGLAEPSRVQVHISVDDWIDGRLEAFPIEQLEPTGQAGTEIRLEGVSTRFREDRILRHLQRLPLCDEFRIWRNGELIPPRQWHGIARIDIDEEVKWTGDDGERSGHMKGEIWIRPFVSGRQQTAFIAEPKNPEEGVSRDPAGIEVRVDGDTIAREFFGREQAGHGVNRIWGWVDVPWLPILGNRTDYLRDSAAGEAFQTAMQRHFDAAFKRVKAERESPRGGRRRDENNDSSSESDPDQGAEAGDTKKDPANGGAGMPPVQDELEPVASRFGKVLNQLLDDRPELAPVVESKAITERGRPAKDRIYPIRPTGKKLPFSPDSYGRDLAIEVSTEELRTSVVKTGNSVRRGGSPAEEVSEMQEGNRTLNTRAGIQLRFSALGAVEAPYVWATEDAENLALDVNTEHPLYPASERPGSVAHRLHCAWVVSVALADRRQPNVGQQMADFTETVAANLFAEWGGRKV
jgi:hypothetical protein